MVPRRNAAAADDATAPGSMLGSLRWWLLLPRMNGLDCPPPAHPACCAPQSWLGVSIHQETQHRCPWCCHTWRTHMHHTQIARTRPFHHYHQHHQHQDTSPRKTVPRKVPRHTCRAVRLAGDDDVAVAYKVVHQGARGCTRSSGRLQAHVQVSGCRWMHPMRRCAGCRNPGSRLCLPGYIIEVASVFCCKERANRSARGSFEASRF